MSDRDLKFIVLEIIDAEYEPRFHIQEYNEITDHNSRYYYVHGLNQYIDKNDINEPMQDRNKEYCFFVYLINPSDAIINDYKNILKHDLIYKLKYQKNHLEQMIEKAQKLEGV